MRIGCCSNMNASLPDGTGREFIERIKVVGFDYVELPLAQISALSDKDFSALVSQVENADIPVEACNNCFPVNLRLTGDSVDKDAVEKYIKEGLMRVNELGSGIVVFGSGPAKNIPDGFPRSKGYSQIVALLKRMSDEAGKYGITVVIEPLRKAECNVINTYKEGVLLSEEVKRENIRVLVDFYHLSVEKEDPEVLVKYPNHLRHAHFANPAIGTENERSFPKSIHDCDYATFFECLGKAGYEGRISLEAYTKDFDVDAPRALSVMRDLAR